MKKLYYFLMLAVVMAFSVQANAQCNYTLTLLDGWSDGWNGGNITVNVNGSPALSAVTMSNNFGAGTDCTEDFNFIVSPGDAIDVVYTAGSFAGENAWEIYDGFGTLVASDGNTVMLTAFACDTNEDAGPQPAATAGPFIAAAGSCPSCPAPTAVAAANITATDADISWSVTGSETLWDIEVVAAGTAPTGTPTYDDVTTNPFTITGLMGSTQYDVYVYADCDGAAGTDDSPAAGPATFFTACITETAPYCTTFDDVTVGNGIASLDLGNCWTTSSTVDPSWRPDSDGTGSSGTGPAQDNTGGGTYVYLETSSGAEGDSAFLFSPVIDLTTLTTPTARFFYHMFGATIGTLALDITTDGGATWTNVWQISGQQTAADIDPFTVANVDLCAFVGTGIAQFRFVGVRGSSFTGDMAVDDFCVEDAGSCPDVLAVDVSSITDMTADISWTTFPSCLSATYTVEVSDGTTVNSFPGETSPFSATGLTQGTQYFVTITPDCVDGGPNAVSFFTLNCDPALQCLYTLELFDFGPSSGPDAGIQSDGWDEDAYVEITTGNQVTTYTLAPGTYSPPSSGTVTITFGACPGEVLSAEYFGTPQEGEVWRLTGPGGFDFTANPPNQPRLNIVACPTCPPAFNEAANTTCSDEVTVSWENGAAYDSSEVVFTYGVPPFFVFQEFSGTLDAATTAAGSYTHTAAGWGAAATVTYDIITYCQPANPGDPVEQSQVSGTFVSGDCLCADQCSYTLTGTDTFGDGWNGGYFRVYLGGVAVDSLELLGGAGPVSLTVGTCPDLLLEVEYVAGGFPAEVQLDIFSSQAGGLVYDVTGHGGTGIVFQELTCPTCLDVTDLTINGCDVDTIGFGWNDPNAAAQYNIEYGVAGFTPTQTATVTTTDTFLNVTGLVSATQYEFYVQADCATAGGIGLSPSWVGPFTIETKCGNLEANPEYCEDLDGGLPICYSQDANDSGDWIFAASTPSTGTGPQSGDHTSGSGLFAYVETSSAPIGDTYILNAGTYDVSALTSPAISVWYHAFGGEIGTTDIEISEDGGTTWTNVFTTSGNLGDVWNEALVDVSGTLTGTIFDLRIVYTTNGSFEGDIAIDDICVKELPQCFPVLDMTCVNMGVDSVQFAWNDTAAIAPINYEIEWVLADSATTGTALATTTDTFFTVNGLMSGTAYDFYVRVACANGEFSAWSSVTCSTNPDFCAGDAYTDTGGAAGNYGVNENETTIICPDNAGDVVYVTFTSYQSETNFDFMQVYNGPDTSYPEFTYPDGEPDGFDGSELAGQELIAKPSGNGCLTFVFTSDGSVTQAGWEASVVCAAPPCYDPEDVTISGIADTTASIGFVDTCNATALEYIVELIHNASGDTNTFITSTLPLTVDTLTELTSYCVNVRTVCATGDSSNWVGPECFVTTPSCANPSTLAASAVTNNSADLSWIDNTAAMWTIEYGPSPYAVGDGGTQITTMASPQTVTGLAGDTQYTWYIWSDCSDTISSAFSTLCDPFVVNPEQCEDFDSGILNSCFSQSTADDLDWTIFSGSTGSSPTGPTGDVDGTGSYMYVETSGSSLGDLAILNAGSYDVSALTTPAVTYFYHMNGECIGDLIAEISEDNGATWTAVNTLSGQQQAAEGDAWIEAIVDISPFLTGTTFDLRFSSQVDPLCAGFAFLADAAIDEVCVKELPLCLDATDLACGMSTLTDINISWTDNNAGGAIYDIEAVPAGGTPTGIPTTAGLTGTTHTEVVGTSDTAIDFYIRTICGTDTLAWVGGITCSTNKDFCGGDLFTDTGGLTGSYSNNENETTVICPDNAGDIVFVAFNGFQIENNFEFLTVYDGTDSSFPLVGSFTNGTLAGQTLFANFGLSGNGCLTFVFTSDGSVTQAGWDATVTCQPPPTCFDPFGLTCGDATNSSLEISWDDTASNVVNYEIEWVLAGTAPTGIASATTTDTFQTATGLTADTCYDFYVRSDCGAADGTGNWVGPLTCCTACDPYIAIAGGEVCEDLDGGLPSCYSQDSGDDFDWLFGSSTPSFGTGAPSDNTTGSGQFMYIETSGAPVGDVAIMNAGTYDVSAVAIPGISLAYHMVGTEIGTLDVEISEDGGTTWVNVLNLVGQQQGAQADPWLEEFINLSTTLTGSIFDLRIVATTNGSFAGDISVDDICVIDLPPPPANDSLCNAEFIMTGVGKTCSSGTPGSLFLSTFDDEASVPAPSFQCGATGPNKDVWYKTVVPAGGRVMIDFPVMPGANMFTELYAGPDKANMTYLDLSCDAIHPKVYPAEGAPIADMLTPGDSLWIRVWDAGNNDLDAFEICVNDPVPAGNTCDDAIAVDFTEFNGPVGYDCYSLDCAFGPGTACAGTADEQLWFSFVAQDANDIIQAGVHPLLGNAGSGFDAVIEVFDGCNGASLGCFDNYGPDMLERVMVGGLTPGATYIYSVHHAGGGSLADGSFCTTHKTFADGQLRDQFCNAASCFNLSDFIQSERDDLNELYGFAGVQVPGYGFEISQAGTVLDVIDHPVADGFHLPLAEVSPTLEYGQTYDVRTRHQVVLHVNGAPGTFWSDYGPMCQITMCAPPVTQVNAQFCVGGLSYYLEDQIFADNVIGATSYVFTFDDGVNPPIVYTDNNYAVNLWQVPGLNYATTYGVTVQANLPGTGLTAAGSTCSIAMQPKPENTAVALGCNQMYMSPSGQFVQADLVYGATMYEWRYTPIGGGAPISFITSTLQHNFSSGTGVPWVAGTETYNVEVRAFAGGVWGDFGAACPITVMHTPQPVAPDADEVVTAKVIGSDVDVTIYPNPTDGDNIVVAIADMDEEVQKIVVEVVDITGKTVHTEQFSNSGSQAMRVIEFNETLTSGMYFVNIYMNDYRAVEKITVE